MHIEIPLPTGQIALADKADEVLLSCFSWRVLDQPKAHTVYVHAWHKYLHLYLHRLVMGAGPTDLVDHRNGNGLDNRSANLRLCTQSQNAANSPKQRGEHTSRHKGVYWDKSRNKWGVRIGSPGIFIGRYTDEDEAAIAYNQAALNRWGEFARLNIVEGVA